MRPRNKKKPGVKIGSERRENTDTVRVSDEAAQKHTCRPRKRTGRRAEPGKPGRIAPPTAPERAAQFRRGYRPGATPRWGFKPWKAETLNHGVPAFSAGTLSGPYEGLEAEECGILDGCAHGRCVRVPEGFTCDCFTGYRLDMTRMACVGEG